MWCVVIGVIVAVFVTETLALNRFNISLSDGGTPVKFFMFKMSGNYDVEFNFKAWVDPKYDPDGEILANVFSMRFLYIYMVNPYGGRDYIPFIANTLQIKRDKWFLWAGTEIYLVYRVNKEITDFFRPNYLNTLTVASLRLINRLMVSVVLNA